MQDSVSSDRPLRQEPVAADDGSGNRSALETLMVLAEYLGVTEEAMTQRADYDPKGPFSATLIAAIERRVACARSGG